MGLEYVGDGAHSSRGSGSRGGLSQPSCIFAAGSLRPDDDSGMPWTRFFHRRTECSRAVLQGARLYQYEREGLRCAAVRLGEAGHSVFGYVIKPKRAEDFASLVKEADRIECYPILYQRDVTEVQTEDGEWFPAYVYHRPGVNRSRPVPGGDWLNRLR